jgi:predicted dehydrogenase
MPVRVLIIGARSARQGTGPFIASAFDKLGAEVCAIVGTSGSTVTEAAQALHKNHGISCAGYTDLNAAIAEQKPDAVAICSPFAFHAQQLATVAAAGCHCLVEKPIVWPATEDELSQLLERFGQQQCTLHMVSQWPQTLAAFSAIHGPLPTTVTDFTMRLSPISIGPNMVPDSAPHFISLLQALLGPGECEDVAIAFSNWTGDAPNALQLSCNYHHAKGLVRAQLLLETCQQRPRPAWYQINDLRVDRAVQMPEYVQQLTAGDAAVPLSDPIEGVVAEFLDALAQPATAPDAKILAGHRNLLQLARAWPTE